MKTVYTLYKKFYKSLNNISNNWHMACMITVFTCDLSMEYNTPFINRNMAGALLIIGFSG